MKYLSVIIPVYNEGQRIKKTLDHVKEYLKNQDFDYEVLIINDGSTDYSEEEIKNQIKNWPKFIYFSYQPNQGKGAAVKYGVEKALSQYILFMDADESTPIDQFEPFKPFLSSCPVIIGSRYLKKGYIKIKQPIWRILFARFSNRLIRWTLGLNISDTQCGFKLFEREAAERIFPRMTLKRWGFDFEILLIAKKLGYPIREVPVFWYHEKRSKVKMSDFLTTLSDLFKVRQNLKKGRYN